MRERLTYTLARERAGSVAHSCAAVAALPAKARTPEMVREALENAGATLIALSNEPIPMRLVCPRCGALHVDEGEHACSGRPHHTHACQHCGEVWRPAIVPTCGVRFLPGFRNDPPTKESPT